MNVRDKVILAALDLPAGLTTKVVCPACLGGASGERCMTISRSPAGVVLWHCHRASCGAAGRDGNSLAPQITAPKRRTVVEYHPRQLPDDELAELCRKFDVKPEVLLDAGVKWDAMTQRVLYPVIDYSGLKVGWFARTYDKTISPKTLTAVPTGSQPISFFSAVASSALVIVEDVPSAICLRSSCSVHTVALGGTYMSPGMEQDILKYCKWQGIQHVVIALDNDATAKAFKMQKELSLMIECSVLPLPKDIKDMTDLERELLLSEGG